MQRRRFLQWIGLGWLLTAVPAFLAACRQQTYEPVESSESEARSDGFQPAGSVADLNQAPLQVEINSIPVIVIRDPNQSDRLVALNATCPHAGCPVNWQANNAQFVCPCHNSLFDPEGKVVRGPAINGLVQYETKTEDETVLVKVG